jgi:hypothetical protein
MGNNVNVITSYHHDLHKLDWINLVYSKNYNLVLYKKDDNLKIGETKVTKSEISIPNYGRCDYAFLHYIITNYDNLPNHSVFTKIHWGDQGIDFYRLLDECINYDYYEVGQGLNSYVWFNNDNLHLREISGDCYQNVDMPYGTGNLFDFENRPEKLQTFEDWYNHIFPDRTKVPGKIYAYSHGPCFSVSRELIRRHPVSVYEYLFERFHPSSKSWECNVRSVEEIGRHFHDNFVRFYGLLFTHDVDEKFKLHPPC